MWGHRGPTESSHCQRRATKGSKWRVADQVGVFIEMASRLVIVVTMAVIVLTVTGRDATSQESSAVSVAIGSAVDVVGALRRWDAHVDGMTRRGDLVIVSRVNDGSVDGRTHEYLAQYFLGIPVHGGGVSRQVDGGGVTVSLFGTLHDGIDVDARPVLSGRDVAARLDQMHGGTLVSGGEPFLLVLPRPDGSYALAYRVVMNDGYFYFADARDGRLLYRAPGIRSQSAAGVGTDFQGNRRKLSTSRTERGFEAYDRMRPAELVTLDVRFNILRSWELIVDHFVYNMRPGEGIWTRDDVAVDSDNNWGGNPAVVGAHSYTGWGYDYFFERHGWEGIDGANGRTFTMVNDARFEAAVALPPLGPEGKGLFIYGWSSDLREPITSLDVVGHELMHGVTHYSVSKRTGATFGLFNNFPVGTRLGPKSFVDYDGQTRTCDTTRLAGWVLGPEGLERGLVPAWCIDGRFVMGADEAGAIHEGYSDIFGEALGFFYKDQGVTADYLVEGDQKEGPVRSLGDPSFSYDPDAYRDRFQFALTLDEDGFWDFSGLVFVRDQFVGSLDREVFGYGGDHWNSLILSHAFYLAVEGGMHRSSGVVVRGVGGGNRADIERIFFRAMTNMMPSSASLGLAAAVIRQSAADLAPGRDAQRAIEEALQAVGLAEEAGM